MKFLKQKSPKNLRELLRSDEDFIFYSIIFFYSLIWVFNLNNKIILAATIALGFLYNKKFRNLPLALLITYLASSIIYVGKTYPIVLIPPNIIPKEIFANGVIVNFSITPQSIVSFLIGILWIRNIILVKKNQQIIPIIPMVGIYMIWPTITDFIASKNPSISLLFSWQSICGLPLLFYWRKFAFQLKKFLPSVLLALVLVESIIAGMQVIRQSPFGKTLEAQQGIEYFGFSADEKNLSYRSHGTFSHANQLGEWLAVVLIITFPLLLKNNFKESKFNYIYFIGLVALASTLSRSAWLGFCIALLIMLYIVEKNLGFSLSNISKLINKKLLFLLFCIGLFFVLPRIERSSNSFSDGGAVFRKMQIKESLELIAKYPIFGVGTLMQVPEIIKLNPQGYFAKTGLSTHNWYLLAASEHGVIFPLYFLGLVLWTFGRMSKKINSENFDPLAISVIGGYVVVVIIGFFQPYIMELYPLMMSVIVITSHEKNT